MQKNKSTIVLSDGGDKGNWATLNNISKFCKRAFPNMEPKEGTKRLFDILYEFRKSFKVHVNNRMREELYPYFRLKLCREIKQHFAPWHFLQVLDCSNQSLNQVSHILHHNYSTFIISHSTFLFFLVIGVLQSYLFSAASISQMGKSIT